jgi:hypothetical protein
VSNESDLDGCLNLFGMLILGCLVGVVAALCYGQWIAAGGFFAVAVFLYLWAGATAQGDR